MKTLSLETTKLLDKLYNLRGKDSVVLVEMDKQKEKEILMVYTCYPFNNIGYTTQRYVVYAELEK